jgi:carbonic anhydrase/acetyltransferase-like protein (isoleucine patch superfamily)
MLRPFRGVLPSVHATAFIDHSAQIIGDVEIGEESSVWMNVVIRGDVHRIRIGRRSNVQDGTVVHVMNETHPTTIGDDVTVGHAALLHGCTIDDCCLIGMGAIVLNGAKIGQHCLVGAGALVTEGKEFPDHSLIVGAPARVIRTLEEAETQKIARAADGYVKRWQRYAEGLKRIE